MSNFIDMTGWIMAEHGVPNSRLTVIKRAPNNKNGSAMWLCECNCEKHTQLIVSSSHIRDGHTLSCGCYAVEKLIERSKKNNVKGFCDDGESKWMLFSNANEKVYYDIDDAYIIEKHTWYKGKKGYATTSIDGNEIVMHQLIGCKGYDHIDRNPLNNRRSNLRPCTQQENCRNRSLYNNNKTGVTGVGWDKRKQKWRAHIGLDYKMIHLGYFNNFDDAVKTRLEAEKKYFGEFASQKYLFEQYGIESEENYEACVS